MRATLEKCMMRTDIKCRMTMLVLFHIETKATSPPRYRPGHSFEKGSNWIQLTTGICKNTIMQTGACFAPRNARNVILKSLGDKFIAKGGKNAIKLRPRRMIWYDNTTALRIPAITFTI